MPTCFVIQPFDSGKFDKRFIDIYGPAIEAAGLEPYRVDNDPSVVIPIDAIEDGIRKSSICLADITSDNPNVWYELGFAFASGRPVVMICSEERTGKKYPFDIQHRSIIPYLADAPSDFDRLKEKITSRLQGLLEKGEALRNIAESDFVAPVEGLSPAELMVIAVVAGSIKLPGYSIGAYTVKKDAERAGITNLGFNLAVKRLIGKKFFETEQLYNQAGEEYEGIKITDSGWEWIDKNDSKFLLIKNPTNEVPF